ncbi:MAG TPA: hypothetical protein EYQ00_10055 [Dehalococcoidia bacterium]|jgi:hypothetical protein|nr:hypothetical protein [Dehalococcoidia bacterium]
MTNSPSNSGGERIEDVAQNAIRLAHKTLDRFPEIKRRHMVVAGGAALSSAIIAAAAVAIVRRVKSGSTEAEAVAEITAEELENPNHDVAADDPTISDPS